MGGSFAILGDSSQYKTPSLSLRFWLMPPAAFIRGLLENVGPEIDPIRLIRRIKNGLEIPGLKPALLKILHDFNLQMSLLEGCQVILNGDCSALTRKLQHDQSSGFPISCECPDSVSTGPLLMFGPASVHAVPHMYPTAVPSHAVPGAALPLPTHGARNLCQRGRPQPVSDRSASGRLGRWRGRVYASAGQQNRTVSPSSASLPCIRPHE
jgi:hypothetical protein